MSKGGGTETTTTEPWSALQPHLKQGFREAQNLYEQYTPEYFTGQTQADFSPDQLTAQQGVRDWATQGAPEIMNSAMGAYKYGTGSSILDVANNPYVSGMARAAAQDAMGQLNPQLANIRGGAVMSGGYGGGRQGVAEGLALGGATDAATRAAANIYGNAYGQGLGHQQGMMGQTGGLMTAGFAPYAALSASGAEQQGREQSLINDAQAKWQFEQNMPYDKLNKMMGTLGGSAGLLGGAGTQTVPSTSGISDAATLAQAIASFN